MASRDGTNEFVEVYNPDTLPVNLTRWVLTDDPSVSGATNRYLPPLTYIDAGGFLRFRLQDSAGTDPGARLSFGLDVLGETLRLVTPTGGVVDTIDFLVQADGVSEGRLPDGNTNLVRFPGSATPGSSN